MSEAEWESLCDGCAQCCLIKLEDEETLEISYTNVVCDLLDMGQCRCTDYPNRQTRVEGCIQLTPEKIADIGWLPPTCAYRLVAENKDLYWWHPLVSGDPESVHKAGMSVRNHAVREHKVPEDDLEDYICPLPGEM